MNIDVFRRLMCTVSTKIFPVTSSQKSDSISVFPTCSVVIIMLLILLCRLLCRYYETRKPCEDYERKLRPGVFLPSHVFTHISSSFLVVGFKS